MFFDTLGSNYVKGLILDILEASATKRDAKAYLKRFSPQKADKQPEAISPTTVKTAGTNLGNLISPMPSTTEERPGAATTKGRLSDLKEETLHVAIVKIRAPQNVDDTTLRGVLHTIEQLSRLGLQSVMVVDCNDKSDREGYCEAKELAVTQADRLVQAIDGLRGKGARRLDSVLSFSSSGQGYLGGDVRISQRNFLVSPLRKGMIPVIASIGFNPFTAKYNAVGGDEVILALTRELAGISITREWQDDHDLGRKIERLQSEISIDRVIILDSIGGTPYHNHQHRVHRYINLEQEFEGLMKAFAKNQNPAALCHAKNLVMMKSALELLPPSSSGFITTPSAVAQSDALPAATSSGPTVGTRRQRNPLIHNLLTDKPAVSFSLPQHRLETGSTAAIGNSSTLLKRGMSLTIVPELPAGGWMNPIVQERKQPGLATTGLRDPRIDYQRLSHLVNDSFGRILDVKAYDERTRNSLAGVIVAGDYQGAAIFTWEQPPPPYNLQGPHYPWVPYLDKFAVLRSAQGTATADVLWNAMTEAFPQGFCWRSRTVNPVNKWYFERSKGSWELPGTHWTMFWSKKGVFDEPDQRHWKGFMGVCLSVKPSWTDTEAME